MNRLFHDKPFDEGTKLKLDIFRRYVREWISVFMTEARSLDHVTKINIFDFFAGPGTDSVGNDGSPLIIVRELKSYCETNHRVKSGKQINLYFNDNSRKKISRLRTNLVGLICEKGCCQINFSTKTFSRALKEFYPIISDTGNANLLLLDQFGISDISPEVVRQLAECPQTDILFFIASSYLKRFQNHPAFKRKFNLSDKNLDYNTIHRFICEYFKEKLSDINYCLAPFSIKKGRNIHGVIFGSHNLYGLEKFLRVCWDIDPQTGEANYNIDKDPSRDGQRCLFEEMNSFRKNDLFESDLKEFIQKNKPNNLLMYEFCLERGFPPKESKKILDNLQKTQWLNISPVRTGEKVRKGAYYLNHGERIPKILFNIIKGV